MIVFVLIALMGIFSLGWWRCASMNYDLVCSREEWYKHFYLTELALYQGLGDVARSKMAFKNGLEAVVEAKGLCFCSRLYHNGEEVFSIRCLCKKRKSNDFTVEYYTIGAFV